MVLLALLYIYRTMFGSVRVQPLAPSTQQRVAKKHPPSAPTALAYPRYIPDVDTRYWATYTHLSDIAFIRFFGISFGTNDEEPLDITDPGVIQGFLVALRHAVVPAPTDGMIMIEGVARQFDTFEIHFRPKGSKEPDPRIMTIRADEPDNQFGCEFGNRLRELGGYAAAMTRQKVKRLAPRIRSIEIINADTNVAFSMMEKAKELRYWIHTLQQVDQKEFAYTKIKWACQIVLHLDDKTEVNLYLQLQDCLSESQARATYPAPFADLCLQLRKDYEERYRRGTHQQ